MRDRDPLSPGDAARRAGQIIAVHNHFTVDGSLIEAWASMKSFRPGDDSGGATTRCWTVAAGATPSATSYGERRSNDTHASATDPDAGLYRTADGQSSRLCFRAHVLMENRNALIVEAVLTHVTGTVERDAAAKNVRHLQDLSRWLQL